MKSRIAVISAEIAAIMIARARIKMSDLELQNYIMGLNIKQSRGKGKGRGRMTPQYRNTTGYSGKVTQAKEMARRASQIKKGIIPSKLVHLS